jgi:transmembrane sensor
MSKERSTVAPQIVDEASEWFVTMREPSASAEDREAFGEWLRTSPVHVGAYLEVARLWTDASHIDRDLDVDLDADPSPNVVPIREGADCVRGKSLRPPFPRRLMIAASLLIAMVAGSTWLYIDRAPTYTTDIGEQRTITLDDGSIVKLNSRSKFSVRMSPKLRQIELVAGQALFEVAHDAKRPFIVQTGNSAIRAVGTQFDVNRKHSGTIVTVIEGRVKLDPTPPSGLSQFFGTAPERESGSNAAPSVSANPRVSNGSNEPVTGAHPRTANRARSETGSNITREAPQAGSAAREVEVYLSAGEQMRVAASGAMERTANPNTAAAISWLQQELIFEGQPLTDVLEEFNRYTRIPIVLADPTLGDLRINAVFHTTNPDSLLRFISRYDNVRVDRSEKEVRISKR